LKELEKATKSSRNVRLFKRDDIELSNIIEGKRERKKATI